MPEIKCGDCGDTITAAAERMRQVGRLVYSSCGACMRKPPTGQYLKPFEKAFFEWDGAYGPQGD